jgi:hypothetical protein
MPLLWRNCALKWGNFYVETSWQRWLTVDFLNHKVFSSIPEKGSKEFDGIYHQHSMNSPFLNYFANFKSCEINEELVDRVDNMVSRHDEAAI